ncbi:MAG: hypothetical protein OEL89_00395 [Candidatus Peregrinibacteria bacterium]|nr:hypothetical protein [Candidatus Peregrinibacteria bacterium]
MFIVLVVILLAAGIYFYNFYVFKTVRICMGDAKDVMVPCNTNQDCIGFLEEHGLNIDLSDAPDFVQEKLQDAINEAVYCKNTCFIRNVRGINPETQELEMLDNCEASEVEIKVEIRGKEGLEILSWIKNRQA